MLSQCALWAYVTVNVTADRAALPMLNPQRNELWSREAGQVQEVGPPEIEGALDLGCKS